MCVYIYIIVYIYVYKNIYIYICILYLYTRIHVCCVVRCQHIRIVAYEICIMRDMCVAASHMFMSHLKLYYDSPQRETCKYIMHINLFFHVPITVLRKPAVEGVRLVRMVRVCISLKRICKYRYLDRHTSYIRAYAHVVVRE